MASQIIRLITTLGLLLLGAAPAWAGRGDIDPNYGEGGRLTTAPGVLLALPGDRLVIADGGTDEGFRVRMVDATGQNVPTFGDGGVVWFDSSAAARTFQPEGAALAPNGDMIFLGSQPEMGVPALLRLDNAGQPVLSFGNRGDGFVEPALTSDWVLAFAVDPDGKIVLLEGIGNPGSICGWTRGLLRLMANGQPDVGFGGDGSIEITNLDPPTLCEGALVFGARADGSVVVGDGHVVVAVDAAGEIDPTFGTDGRLTVSELAWTRGLLLPDGSLLVFGSSTDTGTSDTVFRKYDRNGQPDLAFGSGSGSVTVDLGTALLGESSAREVIDWLTLDPDGEHVVAQLSLSHADGSFACSGIARLAIDGTPDATFGRNGLTCLNVYSAVIAVQSNGAPLIFLAYPDFIGRLLPDNTPSPGLLRVTSGRVDVDESAGAATVTIERLAGRDGAVSANFATVDRTGFYNCNYRRCQTGLAAANSDYTATSGRLDWASGEESQRTVTVSILEDGIDEKVETFGVDFTEPGGGALLFAGSLTVYINDNDVEVVPPPDDSPPPPPLQPGGGGSVSWATALALLGLLLLRRRDCWQRAARMRSHEK